jgi:FkbM family methyltransferase
MDKGKIISSKYLRLPLSIYYRLPPGIRKRIYFFLRINIFRDLKILSSDKIFKVRVNNRNAFKIKHYGGPIEQEIFTNGLFTTWESDLGWLWIELVRNSKVIIDIGANKGIYSLVAKALNPNSRVIAFEPSVNTYDKLVFNVKLNDFEIHCEKLAVSHKSRTQTYFDIPDENQTTASLSSEKMKNWEGYSGAMLEYLVETISLADYIEHNKIEKIDLIKIDIEMHEPEAFEGMGEYLFRYKPVVVFEMLSENIADRLSKIIDLEHFSLFHLKKDHTVEPMDRCKISNESIKNGEWNYVLVPKTKLKKIEQTTSLLKKIKT